MSKAVRAGKVFIDWGQNDPWRSTVAPWSVRGYAVPTVARPVTWGVIERVAATGRPDGLLVLAGDLPAVLDREGDPFAPLVDVRQQLPAG
jgi:bifunctional non-homologous end joining protein LigD